MPISKKPEHFLQFSRDLLFVLRGIWVLLVFHSLGILVFLFLPQGTDILLLLLENSFQVGNPAMLVFLMMGVLFWSVSSEFSCRMLLYMTDNSGHSLSLASVKSRKSLQRILAKGCLYAPLLILGLGLIKAYFQNQSDSHFPLIVLLVLLLVLLAEACLLYQLYHAKRKIGLFRKWMRLTAKEAYWTGKLYGIFNLYRIDLPLDFVKNNLTWEPTDYLQENDLPREQPLPNGAFIPVGFILIEKEAHQQPYPTLTCIYRIPLHFYHCLIKQMLTLVGISICLIIIFSLLPLTVYGMVGAAALLCFGFGSWQLMYLGLDFLDKAQPLGQIKVPYRIIVMAWVFVCSYFNQDHPIRLLHQDYQASTPTVRSHFEDWARQVETMNQDKKIPVYLIAPEGGALRTGAFTAMILSKLADADPNFSKRIYAFSTVSGGSLGAGFFQSIQVLKDSFPISSNSAITKRFFEIDYLSPTTGKLVFAEIVQCLIPWHMAVLDRAICLEKSWESGWSQSTLNKYHSNQFACSLPSADLAPALLFQTVEAETGLPCVWSNLSLSDAFPLSKERDLVSRYPVPIAMSSTINLSARFPLVAPAAMFSSQIHGANIRRHYVDGGYFDNSGQENLLALLRNLPFEEHPRLQPKIVCFNFSEKDSSINVGIRLGNEFAELLTAAYQTRNARTALAINGLNEYCLARFGPEHLIQIELGLKNQDLPMNWVLSHTAMQRMESYCNQMIEPIKTFISSSK